MEVQPVGEKGNETELVTSQAIFTGGTQVVAGESSLSNSGKAGNGSYYSPSGPYHFPPRKKKGGTDDDEVDYDYIPPNRWYVTYYV